MLFFGGRISFPSKAEKPKLPDVKARSADPRAMILSDYLETRNSPMRSQAKHFIDAADHFGVDWKLVPAISGVESTFGRNSYGFNAWGWGINGNQSLGFKSWRSGIFTVTEGLKKNYIDKGLTNPYSMNRAYATSSTWGGRVTYFMNDLEEFSKAYTQSEVKISDPFDKTESAKLALML